MAIPVSPSLEEQFAQLAYMDDPYPLYSRLRAEAPVFRAPDFWYVTPYDLAEEVFRDPRTWASNYLEHSTLPDPYMKDPKEGLFHRVSGSIILFNDGEVHRRLRRLVAAAFTARGIETFRNSVREAIQAQLDEAMVGRAMDFKADFAIPMPNRVILEMLGIPQSEAYRFYETSDVIIAPFERGTPEEWFEHADSVFERHAQYILETAAERRAQGGDGLLCKISAVQADGDRLSDVELISLITFLITAGFETTANTFVNGMYWLLRNPEQLRALQSNRALLPSAVEEILRYDPATRNSGTPGRFATEDTTLGGQTIRRGDRVLVSIHGANHDPAVFSEPDAFDVTRHPNRHLSFAYGPHTCLGNSLARMELQLALEAVLDRLPRLELAGDVKWEDSFIIRRLESLPVCW